MTDVNPFDEYIDNTHREAIESIRKIRLHTAKLKERIAAWEPRPIPDNWE